MGGVTSRHVRHAAAAGDALALRALLEASSPQCAAQYRSRLQLREALFDAAECGSSECVTLLIEHGADPDARADNDFSALMVAAALGHVECVAALLRGGASVETPQRASGRTALMCAVEGGHRHCVEALLASGANVNAQTSHGWMLHYNRFFAAGTAPLAVAAICRRGDLPRLLLERGADGAIVDGRSKTAADVAREDDTRALLRRAELGSRSTLLFAAAAREGGELAEPRGGALRAFALHRLYDRRVWRVVMRFAL
jgi:ankyrin repeat protein